MRSVTSSVTSTSTAATGELHGSGGRSSLAGHTTASGTRLSLQRPVEGGHETLRVVLFDGLPMIEVGVPEALVKAQESGALPPTSAVYVESIEGAEKRGPTRCSSLTTARTLDRFAAELDAFIVSLGPVEGSKALLVGHSLGAISALHIASSHPSLGSDVVLLSAALWWPGDDGQLSGDEVMRELESATEARIWMAAGEQEEQKLLQSNDALIGRLSDAGRPFFRASHAGGHEIRPEDVVSGIQWLLASATADHP